MQHSENERTISGLFFLAGTHRRCQKSEENFRIAYKTNFLPLGQITNFLPLGPRSILFCHALFPSDRLWSSLTVLATTSTTRHCGFENFFGVCGTSARFNWNSTVQRST